MATIIFLKTTDKNKAASETSYMVQIIAQRKKPFKEEK